MTESIVGPWARDKLDRLGKYLNAYTTILKNQKWCRGYHYIDAFAGPGSHEVRSNDHGAEETRIWRDDSAAGELSDDDQRQFIAGSPQIALDLKFPFTSYVFVEKSVARVAKLEGLRAKYGASRRILIRQEDCTKYLKEKVAENPRIDWKSNRAVVFLDPFGMQVEWDTIDSLARTQAIEIFLNFPVGMAIQRFLLRRPENIDEALRKRLDIYFGSPLWFDTVYQKQKTLFGDQTKKVEASGIALLRWYRQRLLTVFSHVSNAALIRNTRGGHLYHLLLASHNKNGVKIANDIILSAGETVR